MELSRCSFNLHVSNQNSTHKADRDGLFGEPRRNVGISQKGEDVRKEGRGWHGCYRRWCSSILRKQLKVRCERWDTEAEAMRASVQATELKSIQAVS